MENAWFVWQNDFLGPTTSSKERRYFAMLTTQHSDLIWLGKSKIPVSVRLVPVRQHGALWYRLLIEPQGATQGAVLLNRTGKPRAWKDLSAAVRFVSRTLPHVRSVIVEVGIDESVTDEGEP